MEYKWQLLPPIEKKTFKNPADYNQIILQLLYNRGILIKEEIDKFLHPEYERDILDSCLFKDMTEAIKLIIGHIKKGNRIVIYGDYDADGVTASALLVEVLSTFKAKTDVYIPERVSEGYGLNKKAINEIKNSGAKMIITVDTGIRNKEEVAYLKSEGLDIVITDHHEPSESKDDLPDCLIIDAKVDNYPSKDLAGVGVAFKLAQALIKKAKLTKQQKEILEKRCLDLVAVGTIADCVKLIGENRILTKVGLEIINKKTRKGLKELINIAQGKNIRELSAWNVSWQIAPRLNAAGRLAHANTAFELLITKSRTEAKKIAEELNQKNIDRQKITGDIIEACQKEVDKNMIDDKMLVLLSPSVKNKGGNKWSEGVVGLVAGKLTEQYGRPTIVITGQGDEIRGSGRSIEGFDITQVLEKHKKFLDKFGGHKGACGFSLKSQQDLDGFVDGIKKYTYKKLANFRLERKLIVEAELDLSTVKDDLIEQLLLFEPHGEGNNRPKFVSRNLTIMDKVEMGAENQHVKFRFNGFWGLAFSQADNWKKFKIGDRVDIAYYLEFNEFNGNRKIQLKLIDIKHK